MSLTFVFYLGGRLGISIIYLVRFGHKLWLVLQVHVFVEKTTQNKQNLTGFHGYRTVWGKEMYPYQSPFSMSDVRYCLFTLTASSLFCWLPLLSLPYSCHVYLFCCVYLFLFRQTDFQTSLLPWLLSRQPVRFNYSRTMTVLEGSVQWKQQMMLFIAGSPLIP